MIKKAKKYVAMFAAMTMLFGSYSNVQAAKKTYNDPYSLAQDYLDFTGVSTVVGEKHTKTAKVKVALHDSDFNLEQEDLCDMWVQDKDTLDKISNGDKNHGHGALCASMISAKSDNGKGIAGISNDIEIYPLSIYGNFNNYNFQKLESAIQYCMDENIPILSISYLLLSEDTELIEALKAYDKWGGLIVCAAGNDAIDNERVDNSGVDNYGNPIKSDAYLDLNIGRFATRYGIDNIIEVTSTRDKEYSLFASYGKTESNIGAPGEFVMVPNTMYFPNGEIKQKELPYDSNVGTSLATPYVAGVCALLKSYVPNASMKEIKKAVLAGVEKRASLKDRCSSGGMINAENALKELLKIKGCLVEEGEYYIKNNRTGKYLTTSGSGIGVNVDTKNFSGTIIQKWKVEYTKQGHYVILPVANEEAALDIYNSKCTTIGNNVQQSTYTEDINQRWVLNKTATNTYKILAAGHNQYAVNAAATATRGSEIVNKETLAIASRDNADEWTFEKIDNLYHGDYYINIGKKYIERASNSASTSLTGVGFSGNANQKWTFEYKGNDLYAIHPNNTKSVSLGLRSGSTSEEMVPTLENNAGTSSATTWKIINRQGGVKRIYSPMTTMNCLALDANSSIANKAKSSNESQEIILEPVNSIYEGTYFMKNSLKNLYVSTNNDGGEHILNLVDTTETDYQKWNFKYFGNGEYSVAPLVYPNMRLDVFYCITDENRAAWQANNHESTAQRWKIEKNDDETVTITTMLNSNYALNYNVNGTLVDYDNARLSINTRNNDALSQRWVLEKAGVNENLDGKTINAVNGTSIINGSKLIYVGNNMYAIQKDGKNLEINRWQVTQYYDAEKQTVVWPTVYVNINVTYSFKTPDYLNENQKFMVKKLGNFYYICPCEIRNSGLTSDGTNTWLNKTNEKIRFSVN